MKILCKRGGSSGAGSHGGGGASASQQVTTPSGVTYEQFMQMPEDERYDMMTQIILNPDITVPDYLDKSGTSKVMYALGMNNKPTVVSDSELDSMKGMEIFRTVSDPWNPPPYTKDILEQIKTSDYTSLSNAGGSAFGRAVYFADDFQGSIKYAKNESSAVMRAKVKPSANIADYATLSNSIWSNKSIQKMASKMSLDTADVIAYSAIANGIDGWHDSQKGYTMIINRGALVASSVNKAAFKKFSTTYTEPTIPNTSWKSSQDA